jgi:hypothetical protein
MMGLGGGGMTASRPVAQYTKDLIFIKAYRNLQEAADDTGVAKGNICTVCRGKRSQAGGFIWRYVEM